MPSRYLTTQDVDSIRDDRDIVTTLVNLALSLSPDSDLGMTLADWRLDLHLPARVPPVAPTIGFICIALKQAVGFLTLMEDADSDVSEPLIEYIEHIHHVRTLATQCLHLLRDRHLEVLEPIPADVRVALVKLYVRAEALTVEPSVIRDELFSLTMKSISGR